MSRQIYVRSRFVLLMLVFVSVLFAPVVLLMMLYNAAVGEREISARMLYALDRALNAGTGGSDDETLSSACGRAIVEGKGWRRWIGLHVIDPIFGKGHCVSAIGI